VCATTLQGICGSLIQTAYPEDLESEMQLYRV
jgi:hypothetical protein